VRRAEIQAVETSDNATSTRTRDFNW
jgi:hypothetical protein